MARGRHRSRSGLLRLHRLRLDLNPRRGGSGATPSRDLAIGILGALTICTVLYVAVSAVLTGMMPYGEIDIRAPLSAALHAKGLTFAGGLVTLGILTGMTSSLLVGNLSQPRILMAMARDGLLPHDLFAAGVPPPIQDPVEVDDPGGRGRRRGGRAGAAGVPGRPGEHRHPVRVRRGVGRRLDPRVVTDPETHRPFPRPRWSRWSRPWESWSTAV